MIDDSPNSPFPDDDSKDLTPEELSSCIDTGTLEEWAGLLIHSCDYCNEPMIPVRFGRRRLKPDHYVRVVTDCSRGHTMSRLFKVNWLPNVPNE